VLRLSIARQLPEAGTDPLPIINLDLWFAVVDFVRARFGAGTKTNSACRRTRGPSRPSS
jgi:hypothetical protein